MPNEVSMFRMVRGQVDEDDPKLRLIELILEAPRICDLTPFCCDLPKGEYVLIELVR